MIQEIRRYKAASPLPAQGAAVLGALDLRGQIVALLDLRRLLGLPDGRPADEGLRAVVVLVHEDRRIRLVVDEVQDVLSARPEKFRALPALPGEFAQHHLGDLVVADARRVLLLRPEKWVAGHAAT